VIGICGGFQMLGRVIHDPHHVEASTEDVAGLGLLPHETVFEREKQTNRVQALLIGTTGPFARASGARIEGYEIHAGKSIRPAQGDWSTPIRVRSRSGRAVDEPEGAVSADGLVFGTYVHGLFENDVIRQALVAWLQARRAASTRAGSPRPPPAEASTDPYERWADVLEAALDLRAIFEAGGITLPNGRKA